MIAKDPYSYGYNPCVDIRYYFYRKKVTNEIVAF